ncbi:MAG: SpaA isopeptide-forming pilin-related protein [Vagococcus sp.]
MKRACLFFISLCIGLLYLIPVETQAISPNEVKVQLTHESQSQEVTAFSIYGISRSDYEKALNLGMELSIEKTKEWLSTKKTPKVKQVIVDASHKAEFTLPRNNALGEQMYYVLVQNQPDREGVNGKDIYQVSPSFISFDDLEEPTLYIYTKRVFMAQLPYFFKYSEKEAKPLANAEFAFYQFNELHEKVYLTNLDPLEWQVLKDGSQAYSFKSDDQGLVMMPDIGLEEGTYYFEETKAPVGYKISKESTQITLVIKDNEEGRVMTLNNHILHATEAGVLPEDIIKKGEPRVINELETDPPETSTPKTQTTIKETPKGSSFLPKTGEKAWSFGLVGLVLMSVAILLLKRRKENE